MDNNAQDTHENEQTIIYFCPGCNRECAVELTLKNGDIIAIRGNNCSIGASHARSQYETDRLAKG